MLQSVILHKNQHIDLNPQTRLGFVSAGDGIMGVI